MSRANSSSTDLIINACLVEGFYPTSTRRWSNPTP